MEKVGYFSEDQKEEKKFFAKNKNGFIFRVKYLVHPMTSKSLTNSTLQFYC